MCVCMYIYFLSKKEREIRIDFRISPRLDDSSPTLKKPETLYECILKDFGDHVSNKEEKNWDSRENGTLLRKGGHCW